MSSAAPPQELSKLQQAVADFKQHYGVLKSNSYGAQIARTGDNALMQEYGNVLARADKINAAIDSFTAQWDGAREYLGLSAIPVIPIVVVAGFVAVVLGGLSAIKSFMKKAGIQTIQKQQPNLTYEQAAAKYNAAHASQFEQTLGTAKMAMLFGGALILYFLVKG